MLGCELRPQSGTEFTGCDANTRHPTPLAKSGSVSNARTQSTTLLLPHYMYYLTTEVAHLQIAEWF